MRISYCRIAYVMECPEEILRGIKNNMPVWADTPRSICTAYENIISFLDDEDSKAEENLYKFIQEVKDNLKGEIGDVIFSN